jgi:hypothetical protein
MPGRHLVGVVPTARENTAGVVLVGCRTGHSSTSEGISTMQVVRISKGTIDPSHLAEAEHLLVDSERALRDALTSLKGLVHYYVGIDRARGALTNVSVWDSLEHAHQMDTLPAMLAQRPILEAAGVTFEPITNHETVWVITP